MILIVVLCNHTFASSKGHSTTMVNNVKYIQLLGRGGGGVLPINKLMGICSWMGLCFHDCIDYYGVAFSTALLE